MIDTVVPSIGIGCTAPYDRDAPESRVVTELSSSVQGPARPAFPGPPDTDDFKLILQVASLLWFFNKILEVSTTYDAIHSPHVNIASS
jgi:hypothetical protein